MAGNTIVGSDSDLDVIECLTFGLSSGPLQQIEGLLETLKDVDMNAIGQSTLLHLGVKLGKLDWVEGLLGEGADPGLRGGGHKTAVEMAEELGRRYPEDRDRKDILRLIHLVYKRENAIKRRLALYGGNVVETSLTDFSQEMAELSSLKESIHSLKGEMSSFGRQMAEEVNQLRRDLSERDILLECIESSVTSSAEELRALKECLGETSVAGCGDPVGTLPTEYVRWECLEGMMRRTIILDSDEGKVFYVRSLYEKLYNMSAMISCVLLFLSSESRVSIMVDCDSCGCQYMKPEFIDHDGLEWIDSTWPSFADFSEMTVYLGAGEGGGWTVEDFLREFSRTLAQMSILLAFGNGGRPYERDDVVHEQEFRRVLKDVEGKRKAGVRLPHYICHGLRRRTQLGKEVEIACVVPLMIADHESKDDMSTVRGEFPSLFKFYEEHVMTTLLNKAKE